MTAAGPGIAELRLLTHRPEPMITWWSAMLGARPRTLNTRMTVIASDVARVVIERSEIAFDYHPEAAGVTAIGMAPGDDQAVRDITARLAELSCHPHRATVHAGRTCLWYRDPNGTEVTVLVATDEAVAEPAAGVFPDELDPAAVVNDLMGKGQT